MDDIMTMLLAQAQDGGEGVGPGETGTQQDGTNGGGEDVVPPQRTDYSWIILLLGMLAIFYFFMIRPNKKRQQEQQQMLSSLNKGVRVRTIGGILGTVVDVRGEEVVLKIDEATNAKMRIMRQAVAQVYGEQSEKDDNK